jgi:hypothetical protein
VIASPPPPSASAVSISAQATFRAGPLTMTASAGSLTVIDATGSGSGWRVMASASDGTAELTGFTASCGALSSDCSLPTTSLDYPVQVSGATTALLEANPGSGMGTITYSGLQWLATPSGAGPVIINVSIQSGP